MRYFNIQFLYYLIYRLISLLQYLWPPPSWLWIVCLILASLFGLAVVIISLKLGRLRRAERHELHLLLQATRDERPERNERWEQVLRYLESDNPAEWQQAIILADNILDDLVKTIKPHGENLGERLKSIEPSDFETLNEAWEAHKVRNRIAHESDYKLSKHEALQTIARYRQVFQEFEYI